MSGERRKVELIHLWPVLMGCFDTVELDLIQIDLLKLRLCFKVLAEVDVNGGSYLSKLE